MIKLEEKELISIRAGDDNQISSLGIAGISVGASVVAALAIRLSCLIYKNWRTSEVKDTISTTNNANDIGQLSEIIEKNPSIGPIEVTPLMYKFSGAINAKGDERTAKVQELKEMINKGDATSLQLNMAAVGGDRVAMFAAVLGDTEIIKSLKAKGVDFDVANDYNRTPAMMAAKRGNLDALRLIHNYIGDKIFEQKDEYNLTVRREIGCLSEDKRQKFISDYQQGLNNISSKMGDMQENFVGELIYVSHSHSSTHSLGSGSTTSSSSGGFKVI